jgi:hypothetical protein
MTAVLHRVPSFPRCDAPAGDLTDQE